MPAHSPLTTARSMVQVPPSSHAKSMPLRVVPNQPTRAQRRVWASTRRARLVPGNRCDAAAAALRSSSETRASRSPGRRRPPAASACDVASTGASAWRRTTSDSPVRLRPQKRECDHHETSGGVAGEDDPTSAVEHREQSAKQKPVRSTRSCSARTSDTPITSVAKITRMMLVLRAQIFMSASMSSCSALR